MAVPRYWREVKSRYRLQGSQCTRCGRIYFPKRSVCPYCKRQSIDKIVPYNLSGEGTVESFTSVYEPMGGFEMQVPYIMALIKLKEGITITGQIVDIEEKDLKIGMPVKMVFRKIGEDGKSGIIYYGYKFSPEMYNSISTP